LPVLAAAQPYAWQQAQHRWLIFQSALALAVFAAAGCFLWFGDSLFRDLPCSRHCCSARRSACPMMLELVLSLGQRSAHRRSRLVLGRQPPAAFGIVAGADGAAARARGQCRRRHHGRKFQPDLHRSGSTDGWRRTSMSTPPTTRRPPRSRRGCAQRPEVEAILPGGRAEAQSTARRSRFSACPITPPIAIAGRCCNPPQTPGPASSRRRRLISEQLARRLKLRIGDRIEVPAPGGNWPLEVVGIYADYGNPKGQIAVNIAALTAAFFRKSRKRDGPARRPAAVPALISALQSKFGLDGRNLVGSGDAEGGIDADLQPHLCGDAALNAFTLGVAGIALLTSLLTLSNSRLPQLAPLWAIGITRRRLAVIELLKTMSVALITALLALPLGLLVAWCLIAVVNVKAFGWRLPFHVFPLQLLIELLGVAMAAALLRRAASRLKLARMQPAKPDQDFCR
jgi:putative ABC transport system permease protein